MWLPFIGLIIGIILGLLTEIRIPEEYSNYLSIAVLSGIRHSFRWDQGIPAKYI